MHYGFSDEHMMLEKTVDTLLKEEVPFEKVRRIIEQEDGFSKPEWKKIAKGGWLGVRSHSDENDEFSLIDLMNICGLFGKHLFPGPFSLNAGFLIPFLSERTLTEKQNAIKDGIMKGDLLATCVMPELKKNRIGLGWSFDNIQVVSEEGKEVIINGTVTEVPYLPNADVVSFPLKNQNGELAMILLPTDAEGMRILRENHMDLTKPIGKLILDNVVVNKQEGIIGYWREDIYRKWTHHLGNYVICMNGEMLGGATAVLEQTVNYVKERKQFGVSVGSFQAVKHILADMYTALENARSYNYYVAWKAEHDPKGILTELACSKLYTAQSYKNICEQAIQLHGGMGFTWEQGLHFWYKASLYSLYHLAHPTVLNQVILKDIVVEK